MSTRPPASFAPGALEHNLKNIDPPIPRPLVVFPGRSGSWKSSSLGRSTRAHGASESVSPYARRLFHHMSVPSITGRWPATLRRASAARGLAPTRSSVGSVTTLSNLLRMLFSRAGTYPRGQEHLDAESFSPNTPAGACPECHGLGRIYAVTERSMVPDDSLTIRERAIAAWPTAWQGQNLRDILTTMGYDIDVPWRELPKQDRDWLLFTDEQPTSRSSPATRWTGEARAQAKGGDRLHGTFTRPAATCCTHSRTPRARR